MAKINDYNLALKKEEFEKRFIKEHGKFRNFICNNIIELRKEAFFDTIYENKITEQYMVLANITNLSIQTIRNIESGKENFTFESLMRLSAVYDMPPYYMMRTGGTDEFRRNQKKNRYSSTKLRHNIASIGWKEISFYFEGITPVMKKTDGSLRVFEDDDTIELTGDAFGSFFLTFFVDANGKRHIFHNYINTPHFRTIGVKMQTEIALDYLAYPICSSVLTISWNESMKFAMKITKDETRGFEKYKKEADI